MTKYRHPNQGIELIRQDQKILWALGGRGRQIAELDSDGILAWKKYEYQTFRAHSTYLMEQDFGIESPDLTPRRWGGIPSDYGGRV